MTTDNCPRVSSSQSDSSSTKQRKRRKWDQPDEKLISDGVLTNVGALAMIALPTVSSLVATSFSPSGTNPPQIVQLPLQQHAATIVQNLVQSRIQDELISREIIINDADSAIRYKLTKRQTQEEIQKCTSAVVITRGKYRPPNAPPDGERPLYLHISAAAHLESTAERIKAVDLGAAMVEEMLKQGSVNIVGVKDPKADLTLTTCVFLGFEADPSLNVASRIRGPNDQYVNHIMNETGATVLIRGRGSGSSNNEPTEDAQQPLHLLLTSSDSKSLEHAKLLAENLLDTISGECGASRASQSNLYGSVPPPSQLEAGLQSLVNSANPNDITSSISTAFPRVNNNVSKCSISQSIGESNPAVVYFPHTSSISGTTSYIGYGGIYPQATPLQQVALALRQSTSPVTATVSPMTTTVSVKPLTEESPSVKDKHLKKRKFQELPADAKGPVKAIQKNLQGSEFPMPRELTSHVGAREVSTGIAPKKSVQQSFGGMPPPPPPPKFNSLQKQHENKIMHKSNSEIVPDTLLNIMAYGDEDDDDDDVEVETFVKQPGTAVSPKPFWAV